MFCVIRDYLLSLELSNFNVVDRINWPASNVSVETCLTKGKTKVGACKNQARSNVCN